jgi:CubicO group peptidase (beta-lactamase class C family)
MHKFSLTFILAIFFTLVMCSPGSEGTSQRPQQLEEASPEQVGMSAARLQRIEQFFQGAVKDGWLPGAVYIVARHGKIVSFVNTGYDDIEQKKPLQKDAIFRLASMTKAIVSVGVMMLYEEGYFVLDDPISKFIPSFKNPKVLGTYDVADTSYTTVPALREVTIRDLLTHVSGISYGSYDKRFSAIYAKAHIPLFGRVKGETNAQIIGRLGALPLEHSPGERYTYGLSTDVLGRLIEVISNMPLADFIQQRICVPLGMNDTQFHVPAEKADRLVKIYSEVESNKLVPATEQTDPDWPNDQEYPLSSDATYNSGGSGMSGTAKDYAIFLQMLLNGGEYNNQKILSRKTIDLMLTNQIGDIPLGQLGQNVFGKGRFGLGFSLVTQDSYAKKLTSIGRAGWGGYFNTMFWFDRSEDLLAVMMTQVAPAQHGELDEKFEILTYLAIED